MKLKFHVLGGGHLQEMQCGHWLGRVEAGEQGALGQRTEEAKEVLSGPSQEYQAGC